MLTFGERAADRVARTVGSWRFILVQIAIIAVWMAANAYLIMEYLHGKPFDPYPFILLNLCLSLQAAFTGPVLQLSGNRKAQIDREGNERLLTAILTTMKAVHAQNEAVQHSLKEQDEILEDLHEHIGDDQ